MVQLGNGMAIIGGFADDYGSHFSIQDKIHFLSCINRNCSISTLSQELSLPRYAFAAIPIPDTIAACISGGKKSKIGARFINDSTAVFPKFFQTASWLLLLEMATAMTTPITFIVPLMVVTAVELV